MPDIFGRSPDDYKIVQELRAQHRWDDYQGGCAQARRTSYPEHRFNSLGNPDPRHERAAEDAQAVGYLTDNLLAIQTMVDEILYTAYRLPDFLAINTAIDEGAMSYGIRVRDRVGRAKQISAPGYEAPSATISETLVTQPLKWWGLDAEWSIDELRGAMFAGVPLDTDSLEAAVVGTMETMEDVGLTGGDTGDQGLLNLPTTGTQKVTLTTQGANMTFSDLTAQQIRDLINGRISAVIEDSKETLGRNIMDGMTVYLPGEQYDALTTIYIGDNAERTLMRSILEDNPWTHFTNGRPLMIERVLELAERGASDTDRMVVGLKNPRVAEMGVSIPPRVLRVMDKGRVICGQVEAKFSSVFVKRPSTIHYVDAI